MKNLLFQVPGGMSVIQELTLPSPMHIIYKVIDFRVWKDTEGFPPHSTPTNKKSLW